MHTENDTDDRAGERGTDHGFDNRTLMLFVGLIVLAIVVGLVLN